jgi:hypothetical protein
MPWCHTIYLAGDKCCAVLKGIVDVLVVRKVFVFEQIKSGKIEVMMKKHRPAMRIYGDFLLVKNLSILSRVPLQIGM